MLTTITHRLQLFERLSAKADRLFFRLKVGLRLKPPEAAPAEEPAQGSVGAVESFVVLIPFLTLGCTPSPSCRRPHPPSHRSTLVPTSVVPSPACKFGKSRCSFIEAIVFPLCPRARLLEVADQTGLAES